MEQCCYVALDDTGIQSTDIKKNMPRERSILATLSDCFVIAVIYSISMVLEWGNIHPHKQYIPGSPDPNHPPPRNMNYTFGYPLLDSTVPTSVLLSLSCLLWTCLICTHGIIFWKYDITFNWKSWLKFAYLIWRIVAFSFAVTSLVTDIIKKFVGSPRPYFIDAQSKYKMGEITSREMDNAQQSFVSGHASEAWALLFLFSLYLYHSYAYAMKCYFMNKNIAPYSCHNPHSYFLADLWYKLADVPLVSIGIIFIPVYFALYVSLSRIIDYKHTPADITAGALLGAFTSYFTYLIYYNEMYLIFDVKELKKNEENKEHKVPKNISIPMKSQSPENSSSINKTGVTNTNV